MILLVDVGNTRIKWMVWSPTTATGHHRGDVRHREVTAAHLGPQLWGELQHPQRVVLATVAGDELTQALRAWIAQQWHCPVQVVTPQATGFGVRNGYPDPQQMGVDRWIALIGARARCTTACCIVDCGTAITIDALAADGQHLGGVIVPGAPLMRQALYQHTRRIPEDASGTVQLFGQCTRDGVWGGTVYAAAATIDGITHRMAQQMTGTVCHFLTGGDAESLQPYLTGHPYQAVPDLLFEGLARIAQATEEPF